MDLYIKRMELRFHLKSIIVADVNWDWMKKKRYNAICQAIANTGRTDVSSTSADGHSPAPGPKLARSSVSVRYHAPNGILSKGLLKRTYIFSAYATGGHYNDMDMLEIGRG